ncbi:MAG: hypothetical protein WDZ29_05040 [Balneolaceae bacterium]
MMKKKRILILISVFVFALLMAINMSISNNHKSESNINVTLNSIVALAQSGGEEEDECEQFCEIQWENDKGSCNATFWATFAGCTILIPGSPAYITCVGIAVLIHDICYNSAQDSYDLCISQC